MRTDEKKEALINYTKLDHQFRLIFTAWEAMKAEVADRIRAKFELVVNAESDFRKVLENAANDGTRSLFEYLEDDIGLCQRPFRSAEDGDALPFIEALPSFCCHLPLG